MLQELAVHSLTTNTAIISKRLKGDSGNRSIWAGEISRNVPPQIDGDKQRVPDCEDPKFWLANISEKSAMWLKVALSLKGEKRLAESLPTKGWQVPKIKVKNMTNLRWREGRFMEMEICLDVQLRIDRCLIPSSAIAEISISGVLNALDAEPEESKILAYF